MEIENINFETVRKFILNNPTRYFSTSSFQTYLQEQEQLYSVETLEKKQIAIASTVLGFAIKVVQIYNVWPDVPIDYFNNYSSLMRCMFRFDHFEKDSTLRGFNNPKVAEWFRTHMKPRSFFNMLHVYSLREGRKLFLETKESLNYAEKRYGSDPQYLPIQNETSAEKLAEYALSGEEGICYYVAKNPNTSPETLESLGMLDAQCVLREVAINPNTLAKTREFLCVRNGSTNTDNTFVDTLKQLEELLNKNHEMNPRALNEEGQPMLSRWRLMLFHDYVSLEYLKQDIVNVEFTHNTIKEPYREGPWIVSSPRDSLSLAVWAHKVRNCVRQRESNVIAGNSEIIFIEQNEDPIYTVEISGPKERGGSKQFTIKEIQRFGAGPGQTREDQEIRDLIGRALGLAKV